MAIVNAWKKPTLFSLTVLLSMLIGTGCKNGSAGDEITISRVRAICRSSDSPRSVRFQGIVTYSDRYADFIVVEDATAGIQVRTADESYMAIGRRVAVRGRTGNGQDANSVIGATLSDLGPATLPNSKPISASDLTSDRWDGRRVSLLGVFRSFRQGSFGQARVDLSVGKSHVVAFVAGGARTQYARQFEDSEVSVPGILTSSANLDGRSFSFTLLVPDLKAIAILKPPPDPGTLPVQSIKTVLDSREPAVHRVRLKGVLPMVGYSELELSDKTGRLPVAGEVKSAAGVEDRLPDQPVDVAAFVDTQGGRRVLTGTFVFQSEAFKAPADVITKIDRLLSLTPNEALRELPVSLDAVVTFYNPKTSALFVQDDTAGIYVNAAGKLGFREGDHVLVSGTSGPGSFAPVVDKSKFQTIGRSPLPEPSRLNPEEIFLGGAEGQWVELEGIIQRVGRLGSEWFAYLVWGAHHYTIRLAGSTGVPASWVDAHVRVRGACGSDFSSRRQFVAVTLFVPGLDYIQVVDPAPSNAFDEPIHQIKSLLQYSRSAPRGHRFRVRGTVTAANPQGPTWIQDASAGVMIRNHDKIGLSIGDVVDVAAFLTPGPFSPQLQEAEVVKVRAARPLQPVTISAEEALSGAEDSKLVEIDAKLLNRSSNGKETIFLMQTGRYTFSVRAGASTPPVEIGSVLRVTGICSVIMRSVALAVIPSTFEILTRSSADLHMLQPAPWLTLQRAVRVFVIAALLIAAALTWAIVLRRRVSMQTQVIGQKLHEVELLKEKGDELREIAESANRAKSTFLANMSHEIRTPLTAILGYTQLVLRDKDLKKDSKAHLHTVGRSGEHLLGLINEVLDLSKIEAGRVELVSNPIDSRLLFEDLEGMFRLRAESKGLQFEMSVSGEPDPSIVTDEQKLRQILINLLGNAIKFTEHGRVGLRVEFEQRASNKLWLSVSVEDTGAGITPEGQAKLFEAFSQLGHTAGGTGLGLAISRKFARMMGGDIAIAQSSAAGTTFRLQIPLELGESPGMAATSTPRRVSSISGGGPAPSILVVDDQAENRSWLLELLGSTGFVVREAENGVEAIAMWKDWNPRLIIMDVQMPVLGGLEATRRIRAEPDGKKTAILVFTASALSEDRLLILQSGANDFLAKPCVEQDLFEKIGVLLGIEYEYEEVTGEETGFLQLAAKVDADRFIQLPAELAEQLRSATSNGDKTLLDTLIVKVRETSDGESANILQQLSDNYEYDALTKLLKEVGQ